MQKFCFKLLTCEGLCKGKLPALLKLDHTYLNFNDLRQPKPNLTNSVTYTIPRTLSILLRSNKDSHKWMTFGQLPCPYASPQFLATATIPSLPVLELVPAQTAAKQFSKLTDKNLPPFLGLKAGWTHLTARLKIQVGINKRPSKASPTKTFKLTKLLPAHSDSSLEKWTVLKVSVKLSLN